MPRSKVVNEDEPLEQTPRPAQPAFASTGLQLEVRGKLFEGLEVGLSNIIDDTVDEMEANRRLDMMRRIFERQRTVFEYRETLLGLMNHKVMLKEVPGMMKEYTEKRTREYAAEMAKFQARHIRDGRRGEFKLSAAQASWVDQFNDESEKKLKEFEDILAKAPREIKNAEDRIERCKRVLDGLEKTDLLLDIDPWDSQREAAE